jgi:hypothetical protein
MYEYGVYEDELENGTVPYYLEQYYYDYCIDKVYLYAYGLQDPDPVEYNFPTASADVLEMETEDESETIYGDAPGGDYTMGYIIDRGAGHIALYGIDFTMNPIPNYPDADGILRYVIRDYVLNDVIEAYENISDSGYYSYNIGNFSKQKYDIQSFLNNIAAAPLPPMALYIVPILAYLVAILVLYLVNRKKGKTFRLWYWYPVIAIGMAVVIYCIGFSTRIIKPRINTMSVLKLSSTSARELNYVAVTTPSNQTCEVTFSDEYDIQLTRQINGYSYDQSDKVDLDSYRVAFRKGIGKTSVRFA